MMSLMPRHCHKEQPCILGGAASFLQLGLHLLRCMAAVCSSSPLGRLRMVLQCAVQEGTGWGAGSRATCSPSLPGRQQGQRKGSCASALMGCRGRACLLTGEIVWQRLGSSRTHVFPCSSLHHMDNARLQPHPPPPGPIPPQCQLLSLTAPGFYILQSQHKEKEAFHLAYLQSYQWHESPDVILSNFRQGVPKSHDGNKWMCWSFPSQKWFKNPIAEGVGAKEAADWLGPITSKNLYSFSACLKHSSTS